MSVGDEHDEEQEMARTMLGYRETALPALHSCRRRKTYCRHFANAFRELGHYTRFFFGALLVLVAEIKNKSADAKAEGVCHPLSPREPTVGPRAGLAAAQS